MNDMVDMMDVVDRPDSLLNTTDIVTFIRGLTEDSDVSVAA